MELRICENYQELSLRAFEIVSAQIKDKPESRLLLCAGNSPLGLYENMIQDHRQNGTSYHRVLTFNVAEYSGIPPTHPHSLHSFMEKHLFSGLDMVPFNTHLPSTMGDLQKSAEDYERLLAPYSFDLMVIGIGNNGQLAFNEPGTPFDSITHVTVLSADTIKDRSRFFSEDIAHIPTHGITVGLDIVNSKVKKVIALASGEAKAKAVKRLVENDPGPALPASILKLHPDVTLLIDKEAGSLL